MCQAGSREVSILYRSCPGPLHADADSFVCTTCLVRYPYLTHLIHNAGGGAFTGLDWFAATWMIMTSFRAAVTYPKYKIQRSGDLSQDGLGWVWQINVGSSWALVSGLTQNPTLDHTPLTF